MTEIPQDNIYTIGILAFFVWTIGCVWFAYMIGFDMGRIKSAELYRAEMAAIRDHLPLLFRLQAMNDLSTRADDARRQHKPVKHIDDRRIKLMCEQLQAEALGSVTGGRQ